MIHRVSAGPYTIELPPNGVAVLYEADEGGDEHRLPGGTGYLDALVQFAGETLRLQAMVDALQRDRNDQDRALADAIGETAACASERKRCADFCRAWLEDFGHADPKYLSARSFVRAAIDDVIDGIESGKPLPPKDAGHDNGE